MFSRILVLAATLGVSLVWVAKASIQTTVGGFGIQYDLHVPNLRGNGFSQSSPVGMMRNASEIEAAILTSTFAAPNPLVSEVDPVSTLDPVTPTPLPANPAVVTFSMLAASAARGVGVAATLFLLGVLYVRLRRNRWKE